MNRMNEEIQGKINQLSTIEHNIQQFAAQKQQFQSQLVEVESAEKELETAKEAHKIIGNIMVSCDKETLQKELKEKKEMLNLRLESFDKQESKMKEKAQELQKEVMDAMKEKKE
ncbi:prefoldin subunit beta [Candidatus Woesearchaeota archaeon]|nr:prefoldin subunit beta [Candidatus Woesearchaeota archaeon]